jgi:hypothetical protein
MAGTSSTVGYTVSMGLSWDLRETVFNPSELQAYALVGIQQDLIQEIVRTYFMRRQMQIRMALRPPSDPVTRAILDLRIAQYGAILDAETGGWFSRASAPKGPPAPAAQAKR